MSHRDTQDTPTKSRRKQAERFLWIAALCSCVVGSLLCGAFFSDEVLVFAFYAVGYLLPLTLVLALLYLFIGGSIALYTNLRKSD